MLAWTHGQPANPTTYGKEMAIFAYRLSKVTKKIDKIQYLGKMSGSVGNYNAHFAVFPDY